MKRLVLILLVLFLIGSVSAETTEAQRIWTKVLTTQVNSVDIDEPGDNVYYGLNNGVIGCYNTAGTLVWSNTTNASVFKVKKAPNGNFIVAGTSLNESYLLRTTDGVIVEYMKGIPTVDGFIRDVDIDQVGTYTLTTFDNSFYARDRYQNYLANVSTTTTGSSAWLNSSFDPYDNWMITTKVENTSLFKYVPSAPLLTWWNTRIQMKGDAPYPGMIALSDWTGRKNFTVYNNDGINVSFYVWQNSTKLLPGSNGQYNNSWFSGDTAQTMFNDVRVTYAANFTQITTLNQTPLTNNSVYLTTAIGFPGVYTNYTYLNTTRATAGEEDISSVYWGDKLWSIAGTTAGTVQSSANNGFTWQIVNSSSPFGAIRFNAEFITHTDGYLYSAGGSGAFYDRIYKSTNGVTWTIINESCCGNMARYGVAMASNPTDSCLYLTGDQATGMPSVYKSSDNGVTWRLANWSQGVPWGGQAERVNGRLDAIGGKLYFFSDNATYQKNMYVSSNGGQTWTVDNETDYNFASDHGTTSAVINSYTLGIFSHTFGILAYDINYKNLTIINASILDIGSKWDSVAIISDHAIFDVSGNTYAGTKIVPINNAGSVIPFSVLENVTQFTFPKPAGNYSYYIYYGNSTAVFPRGSTSNLTAIKLSAINQTSEARTEGKYFQYNLSKELSGNFQRIDVAAMGAWIVATTTSKMYHQQVTSTGLGLYGSDGEYNTSASSGTSYSVASADFAAFSVDGRNLRADIYQIDATLKGTYTTGGNVRSVDIAQQNALWVAAGGDDGKLYIFSKDSSSNWYVYYAGDSESAIRSVAVSWRGEYVVVGRTDGSFELYNLQIVASSQASAYFQVMKNGYGYPHAPIIVYESTGYPYSWTQISSGVTDGTGRYSFAGTVGYYYKAEINSGEAEEIAQLLYGVTEMFVQVPYDSPVQSALTFWGAYDQAAAAVTWYYNDTNQKTTSVTFKTVRSVDGVVWNQTTRAYVAGTPLYEVNKTQPWINTSYVLTISAIRAGSTFSTTIPMMGQGNTTAGLPAFIDPTVKKAMMLLIILTVGGLFSYMGGPEGAVVTALTAAGLAYFHWLDISWPLIGFVVIWAFLGLLGRKSGDQG